MVQKACEEVAFTQQSGLLENVGKRAANNGNRRGGKGGAYGLVHSRQGR